LGSGGHKTHSNRLPIRLPTYFCWSNKFSIPLPTSVGPTYLATNFSPPPHTALSLHAHTRRHRARTHRGPHRTTAPPLSLGLVRPDAAPVRRRGGPAPSQRLLSPSLTRQRSSRPAVALKQLLSPPGAAALQRLPSPPGTAQPGLALLPGDHGSPPATVLRQLPS
jgi:hypothetical protein